MTERNRPAMKVMIRTHGDKVFAYFATMDEAEKVEVACVSRAVFDAVHGAFDQFQEMLRKCLEAFLKDAGAEPQGWFTVKKSERG